MVTDGSYVGGDSENRSRHRQAVESDMPMARAVARTPRPRSVSSCQSATAPLEWTPASAVPVLAEYVLSHSRQRQRWHPLTTPWRKGRGSPHDGQGGGGAEDDDMGKRIHKI